MGGWYASKIAAHASGCPARADAISAVSEARVGELSRAASMLDRAPFSWRSVHLVPFGSSALLRLAVTSSRIDRSLSRRSEQGDIPAGCHWPPEQVRLRPSPGSGSRARTKKRRYRSNFTSPHSPHFALREGGNARSALGFAAVADSMDSGPGRRLRSPTIL
jgi:hypothetical protein